MSINLRTGQPGHGKSYSAVRVIEHALAGRKWVATNVPMADGWAWTMAGLHPKGRFNKRRRAELAERYESMMYFVEDLTALRRLRLPPCGTCKGCRADTGCIREGRGVAVLDEAHTWLNSRTWNADTTGKGLTSTQAAVVRLDVIGFFSKHRHRGWNVELLTQDPKNLDNQVRTLYETHTIVRNMKRFRVLGVIPIFPFNLFVAVTRWNDNARSRLGVDYFLLNKKLARCYDTFGCGRDESSADDILIGGWQAHGLPGPPAAQGELPAGELEGEGRAPEEAAVAATTGEDADAEADEAADPFAPGGTGSPEYLESFS